MTNFNSLFEVDGLIYFNADLEIDSPLFLNPNAVEKVTSTLFDAKKAQRNIAIYIEKVCLLYQQDQKSEAQELLRVPHEINYTRLGYGQNSVYGRGTSLDILDSVLSRLIESKIDLKLIKDYPQFLMLLTPNFGPDRLSDLVTNIIYEQLIQFTHKICKLYDIPMIKSMQVTIFDAETCKWDSIKTRLPVDSNSIPIVLVPNDMVISQYRFSANAFLQRVLLTTRQYQLKLEGIKSTKKDIYIQEVRPYGNNKEYILQRVVDDPELILDYLSVTKRLLRL